MARLHVGAIVLYCPGDLQHDGQSWHAAVVTRVRSAECCDLIVAFSDGSGPGTRRSQVNPSAAPNRAGWRWPDA